MHETNPGTEQGHVADDVQHRPPRARDDAACAPSCSAPENAGNEQDRGPGFASVEIPHPDLLCAAALEISGTDFRPAQQFGPAAGKRDQPIHHDVAAMRELERVERILLDQEHGQFLTPVELPYGAE